VTPHRAAGLAGPALLLLVLVLASFAVGKYPVSPADLLRVLAARITGAAHDLPAAFETVVFQVRLPRVAAGVLVGAALAAAGATYQGLFRNPLVSPDVLGVSSGAGLGAALGIFLALPVVAVQGLAFAFGLAAVAIAYGTAGAVRRTHDPILVLVLAGVVVGTLFGAGISLLKYLADPYDQLPAIEFWLLGSLASARLEDLAGVVPAILLGLLPLVLLRWRINVLALGDDEARALGVDARRLRPVVVAAATLVTAAAVSITGIIGWVGLVVPHVARLLVGPEFTRLLPAAMLLGAGYVLAVDDLARTVARVEVPLGVLNAAVGAPFFLWLLARAQRAWS
jgi:iron complex transport system permease protein